MTRASRPVFQRPADQLEPFARIDASRHVCRAYLRLLVRDQPGVIAAVSETIAEAGVSIDSFLQKPAPAVGGVPIALTTHEAPETVIRQAVDRIAGLDAVVARPRMLRIAPV